MKGAKVRRLLSRSCLVAAGAALILAVAPFGASAQTPAPRPRVFSTATSAVAIDYVPDQQGGLTPIKDTFHQRFVTGLSTMSSSNGPSAKATVVDPGNGATQGPANACPVAPGVEEGVAQGFIDNGAGFIGTPLLNAIRASNQELQPLLDACVNAKWPFSTQADGLSPDSRTQGALQFGQPGGQLYGDGGGAHAVINKDGTSNTDAAMGALKIAPVPGGGATGAPLPPAVPTLPGQQTGPQVDNTLFSSGSSQSTTANYFDSSAAVSHAESRVNGVKVFGGLFTIDSITSIAESRYAAGSAPVGASSTTVQGVKFLGQPATIDDKGVHPQGNPADDSFNQALKSAGLSIRLVGATQGTDDKGFMTAQSDGVAMDFEQKVSNAPSLPSPPPNPVTQTSPAVNGTYFVRYNFASVASRALARDLTFPTRAGSSPTPTPSFSTSAPAGQAQLSGHTGGTTVGPVPTPDATQVGAIDTVPTLFGFDLDLRWLYLAFTLSAFAVCISPRLLLPHRLPAASA